MMSIPGLTEAQLKLVKSFFSKDCQVKLFGSRVAGNFRALSDLDICILSTVSRADIAKIRELFDESSLPFTVDIVVYSDCDESFKKIINETGVCI